MDEDFEYVYDSLRREYIFKDGMHITEEQLHKFDQGSNRGMPHAVWQRLHMMKQKSRQARLFQQKEKKVQIIGLDFETYSAVDLPKHGLDRYVSDPTFRPLIASFSMSGTQQWTLDFVEDYDQAKKELVLAIDGKLLAAHNAPFEQAVLRAMGIEIPSIQFIDSAVVARAAGAGSSLAAAAPQLLGIDKMEQGWDLIKLFSMPGNYQERNRTNGFEDSIIDKHHDEWALFQEYCELDAKLSLDIVMKYMNTTFSTTEQRYQALTMDMNQVGWPVDVESVEEMNRRFIENKDAALADFRLRCDASDLNLASTPQLVAWCKERGVTARSFDEAHVARLLSRIQNKLAQPTALAKAKREGYEEVEQMLITKQILGGSSLKKLEVILNTVHDGKLKDQYLHCGAGQSLRTTGRGVQMQNLPRLGALKDMATLPLEASDWTNTELSENLRQVFTSADPKGQLIVGDFASVESRGLAWLAGEEWKLQAYRDGKQIYELLAAKIFGIPEHSVTKPERQVGKVGELSCGYGAGPDAVKDFAANMGLELSLGEASKLVIDWRVANPAIVDFWDKINDLLLSNLGPNAGGVKGIALPDGMWLNFHQIMTPASLIRQNPDAQSVAMVISRSDGSVFLRRIFHGLYWRGRDLCYYKPSDRKTGDLWSATFMNPKTKQLTYHKLYGGKLAGILTQSLCREIFFGCLADVALWCETAQNVTAIGQFHDEIVLDWHTNQGVSLDYTKGQLEQMMSRCRRLPSFPLEAKVESNFRYIK